MLRIILVGVFFVCLAPIAFGVQNRKPISRVAGLEAKLRFDSWFLGNKAFFTYTLRHVEGNFWVIDSLEKVNIHFWNKEGKKLCVTSYWAPIGEKFALHRVAKVDVPIYITIPKSARFAAISFGPRLQTKRIAIPLRKKSP